MDSTQHETTWHEHMVSLAPCLERTGLAPARELAAWSEALTVRCLLGYASAVPQWGCYSPTQRTI